MNSRFRTPSRRSIASLGLLTAMLFYVSGAALWVHYELDHSHDVGHRDASVVCADTHGDAHKGIPQNAPGPPGSPKSPSQNRCQVCDMLIGATRSTLIVEPDPPLVSLVDSLLAPIPADAPIAQTRISTISRRGPPSLG